MGHNDARLSSTPTTLRHPRMVLLATMPLNQNLPEVESTSKDWKIRQNEP